MPKALAHRHSNSSAGRAGKQCVGAAAAAAKRAARVMLR